jgi:UDP-4-amino-4,6-dideoxy-N-acetyl-beta-L-altrosamine transaminase
MKTIPYGRQFIDQQDIDAVVAALKGDYLTQGPAIMDFEKSFADYVGSKYAVAVSNGTAALHLCALALNVKTGDKVITTPITFVASANCVTYCGGEVIFADIERESYLLDINSVRAILEADSNREIKGIIPVNFAGRVVDLIAFRKLADEFGCWIIEDACHSPGGYFIDADGGSTKAGSGEFADLSIFSFHPVKHIATGEGGMITTNDETLYNRLLQLRTHGITRNTNEFLMQPEEIGGRGSEYPGWYMEMKSLGYNYRITDFQAALGVSQLKKANAGISSRRGIAVKYFDAFKNCDFILGQSGVVEGHAYHLYVIEVKNRLELYEYLKKNGIYAQVHYIPAHLMPYYQQFGWKKGDLSKAESYYEGCLSLPMYPTLSQLEQEKVINTVFEFYGVGK